MKVCIWFFTFLALLSGISCSTVLIADYGMSKMIELTTRKPFCLIHTDRGNIRNMLLSADPRRVRQMTDDSIFKIENVCKSQNLESAHQGGFIYPGTKWCGPGTTAKNHSDLGYHAKEDACCRDHDNCPENLLRGQCKQGICNNSAFTSNSTKLEELNKNCIIEFVKSDRYLKSNQPRSFSWAQKPAKILNWFFTKFGLL